MHCVNFKNVEDLDKYLLDNHYNETKYFVQPDYIKSIFGISHDGLLLYSYTKMAENLYEEYLEDDIDDPYTAAIEWIDFNVGYIGSGSPIVVYDPPLEGYDCLFECDDLDEFLNNYESTIIGMDKNDNILVDSDLCEKDKSKLEEFTSKYDFVNIIYV